MKRVFLFLILCGTSFNFLISLEKRIITLAPNLTEIIYYLGLEKHLIANTIYCDYPPEAKNLPKIGDMWNFDIEKIVEYNPDFVLASFSGNPKTQVERLISLGVKVYLLKEERVEDILSNIIFIGKLFNIDAEKEVNSLADKIKNLPQRRGNKKVLFLLSIKPYYAVSKNTFIGDMLRICGFENVLDTKIRYPLLSEEDLMKLNPDIIFVSDRFKGEKSFLQKKFLGFGKKPLIYFVEENKFSRPGPRIFDLIVEISRIE